MLPIILGFRLLLLFLREADAKENCHCVTQGCVLAAVNLLNSIDTNVDPCQNFYQFACGKWKKDNPIPDEKSSHGPFNIAAKKVAQQLRTLLEDDSDGNTTNSIRFTKALYKACMDLDQIEYLKSTPIHSFLNDVGGWPVINDTWKDNLMDLTSLSILIHRQLGRSFVVSDGISMDWKNETNHILMISQMHPAITRDFYLNDIKYGSKIDAYKEFFVGVVHLIASDMNMTTRPERIESHWSRLIDFERRLANITIPRQEQENISHLYNKFTMSNFTALIDAVNWELYYKSIMPVEVFDRLIKPKTDEFTFNVMHPKFFKNFNDLLSSTTKETIFDYMIWRMISGTTHFFDNRFRTLEQKHDSVTTGSQTVESRWKICSGYSKHVDMASGALYVRNFFTKEDNQEANILANNLKESFKNIIRHTEWMDRETQIKAVEKANYMIDFIGYPDFIVNDSALEHYYANLSFKQNASFLELHHALAQWEVRKNYFDLLKSFDRNKFDVNPAIVNAFYSHLQNSIMFPAAILQPPFFHYDYPKYVTYGLIGAIMGHEVTHGFDSTGHQFDKIGSLKNWWSPSSKKNFDKQMKCIRNQYGEYVEPLTQEHLDGNLTVGENIADNGGVKTALSAYKEHIERTAKKEKPLPGLNLTVHQAFFASYATFWCQNVRKETMLLTIKTDVHSPHEIRVNGPLSNIPEFAEAYACPKGSPMFPDKKCSVW